MNQSTRGTHGTRVAQGIMYVHTQTYTQEENSLSTHTHINTHSDTYTMMNWTTGGMDGTALFSPRFLGPPQNVGSDPQHAFT